MIYWKLFWTTLNSSVFYFHIFDLRNQIRVTEIQDSQSVHLNPFKPALTIRCCYFESSFISLEGPTSELNYSISFQRPALGLRLKYSAYGPSRIRARCWFSFFLFFAWTGFFWQIVASTSRHKQRKSQKQLLFQEEKNLIFCSGQLL